MEVEPKSDAINNFRHCLQHQLKRGAITEAEAFEALNDFIAYEHREDEVMSEQGEFIDDIVHAVSEGWLSDVDALIAIRDFHSRDRIE